MLGHSALSETPLSSLPETPAAGGSISQDSRFDAADTFYGGAVTVALAQASRFDAADTFYAGTVIADETVTQDSRFDADDEFYGGTISAAGTAATQKDGDGFRRRRPLRIIRTRVERQLDEVLDAVQDASAAERPSTRRKHVKAASERLKAIEAPLNLAPAIEAIEQALSRVARAAAAHQGAPEALLWIEAEIEAVVLRLENERLRRKRNQEALIWLLM